jgi:hypothetical protein
MPETDKEGSWLACGARWGLSELTSWGKSSLTMVLGPDLDLLAMIKMFSKSKTLLKEDTVIFPI